MAIIQLERHAALAAVKSLKIKNITKSILRIWWEFCSFTSLHGMRNLVCDIRHLKKPSTGKRYSRKQRIAAVTLSSITWGGAFIIGAAFTLTMITLVWQRFQATPTITTIDTYYYPIWNVPFPAVTICNINQVYRPATKNIERKLLSYGVSQSNIDNFFKGLAGLVKPPYRAPTEVMLNVSNIIAEMGYTTETLLREVMQPCNKMISSCSWLDKDAPCDELFKVSKSSEGFCCSFNYHKLENGTQKEKYLRVSGAGDYVGLRYMLSSEVEHYVSYTISFHGFTTMIHFPGDFVDMPPDIAIIQPGYFIKAMITPSVVETDASVRWLPLEQRKCRFPDEYHSLLYDQYRHSSCITRCRLFAILERCNCIPFHYPHTNLKKYEDTRQCSLHDSRCLRNVRTLITSLQPPSGIPGFETQNDTGLACDCMPACVEQRYDTQYMFANRDQAPTGGLNLQLAQNITNDEMRNYTVMSVAFKSSTCIKYRRSLYMTWDGFFASFGGIFGICLGGSIVSLVELVYFCVVQILGRIILPTERMDSRSPKIPPRKINRNTDRRIFMVTQTVSQMQANDIKEMARHLERIEMKDML